MRRRSPAAAALAAAAVLAACGTDSADLFVVERSGVLPDADLQLVVGDGGTVTCDGEEQPISSDRLLEARTLARDLEPLLREGIRVPAAEGSQLRFRVLGGEGEARFADTSAARRPVLARVVAFTRQVARDACGLRR